MSGGVWEFSRDPRDAAGDLFKVTAGGFTNEKTTADVIFRCRPSAAAGSFMVFVSRLSGGDDMDHSF
mgnify:CR=1 FL=1